MKNSMIILIIIIIAIVVVIIGFTINNPSSEQDNTSVDDSTPNSQASVNLGGDDSPVEDEEIMEDEEMTGNGDMGENLIMIFEAGYSPKTITINKGESVTFTNEHTRGSWPASDLHPTHRNYPGSNINKCGSNSEEDIFDACKSLGKGESYTFTFNEVGTWDYHDHMKSSFTGTIIVE
jgi:plastocyanin